MNRDEEITYGPRKFGLNSILLIAGLTLVGILFIVLNLNNHEYGATRAIMTGVLAIGLAVLGGLAQLRNIITGNPRVTIYSTGVSYALSNKSVFEARWDSLSEFEMVRDYNGRLDSLSATLIGDNISDNLRNQTVFSIPFLKTLAVEPDVLLSELNQTRTDALGISQT